MSRPGPPRKLEPVDDCAALILADDDPAGIAAAVSVCEQLSCWPITVVLGPNAGSLARTTPPAATVTVNRRWEFGPGAALAAGFTALTGGYEPSRTLVLPARVHLPTKERLAALIEASKQDGMPAATLRFRGETLACVTPQLYPAMRETPDGRAIGEGLSAASTGVVILEESASALGL